MTFASLFLKFSRSVVLQMQDMPLSTLEWGFFGKVAYVLVQLVPQCMPTESETNLTRATFGHLIIYITIHMYYHNLICIEYIYIQICFLKSLWGCQADPSTLVCIPFLCLWPVSWGIFRTSSPSKDRLWSLFALVQYVTHVLYSKVL